MPVNLASFGFGPGIGQSSGYQSDDRVLAWRYADRSDGRPPYPPGQGREWRLESTGGIHPQQVWRLYASPQQAPSQSPSLPGTLGASQGTGQFPTIPDFGLPDIAGITAAINQMQQSAFDAASRNRIPGQGGLEAASSAGIQQLLSPAEYFPGTSREAAEESSLRGVPGSGSADSTWVRRTREEQLREMGLGQQFFNAAIARNPIAPQYDPSGLANYLAQLPGQRANLLTQQQQFAQSQQQQRDLAIAQMENAFRIAQLQALRGGSALRGGPSYGYGGYPSGVTSTPTRTPALPAPPFPTPEGFGIASSSNFPDVNQAFPQIPFDQGWDVPLDIPIDFNTLADPEALYA